MAEEYREDSSRPDRANPSKRPGRKSKAEKWAEVHEQALVDFGRIQSALRDERMQCLKDRRFYSIAGAMWEGPLSAQFEHKPRLEVNKIAKSIYDIIAEYRRNTLDVRFMPKDGADADMTADACASAFRADCQDSPAEQAFGNCYEEGVGGGIGAFRLRTAYEDEEDEEDERQRIRIEPIVDADSSVWFDLDSKLQDKSDARYAFLTYTMTREEYHRQYPDDDMSTWPNIIHQYEYDWLTPAVVRVAEYYCIEETREVIHFFRSGVDGHEVSYSDAELDGDDEDKEEDTEEENDEPTLRETLAATGYRETRSKTVKRRKVHKWLMNGMGIMEDCGYIAGKYIPIIVFYARHSFVDNIERCKGHVRDAVDSQRILNMQVSKMAEIAALSTIEKPIFLPEQMAGLKLMWEEDNIVNRPYLLAHPAVDAAGQPVNGPTGWTKAPQVPQAMAALIQLTQSDIEQMLGNPQQAEKQVSHVAGKTVQAILERVDARSQLYIENMAIAMRWCGTVWLAMAAEVYTEAKRKMKGIGKRGERQQIELMKPMIDPETGRTTYANDFSRAKYDVAVDVGPSSKSRRDSIVRTCIDMMMVTQDPDTQTILSNTAIMHMEGEGIEDLRKYSRMKMIKLGAATPTEEEQKMLQEQAANTPPDPTQEYIKAETAKAQAEAQRAQIDASLTAARVDKTKADTFKVLADVEGDHKAAALNEAKTLAGIELDRHKARHDTTESLHRMATTAPQPGSPSGPPIPSESPSGSAEGKG